MEDVVVGRMADERIDCDRFGKGGKITHEVFSIADAGQSCRPIESIVNPRRKCACAAGHNTGGNLL